MENTLLSFLFMIIGIILGFIGISQSYHCLFFGIPTTIRFKRNRLFVSKNNIIRNYILTCLIYGGLTIIISILILLYASISLKIGYGVGLIFSSIIRIKKGNFIMDTHSYFLAYFEKLNFEILNSMALNSNNELILSKDKYFEVLFD